MSATDRAVFDPAELAVVLSYYELGVIESITDFPRGSRRSPKVGIVAQRGKYLLKRRSLEYVSLDRVRFVHRVLDVLSRTGFPAAKLVRSRVDGQTLVQVRDHLYELFEFVAGQPFQQTAAEAREAGTLLARFHQVTEGIFSAAFAAAPRGDFHDAGIVRTGLCAIGSTLSSHDSFTGDEAELGTLVQSLLARYDAAAERASAAGFSAWPERIIHSDWHPGNLVFRHSKIIAVVDYDSLRFSRQVTDVANGALQFSILAGGDPVAWPDHLDEGRFQAFLSAYEALQPLAPEQRRCLPWLMAEALIAECVPPITETGSVGQWSGFRVLQMVQRKLTWLEANAERLMGTVG